jgi:WD40 repeat protein
VTDTTSSSSSSISNIHHQPITTNISTTTNEAFQSVNLPNIHHDPTELKQIPPSSIITTSSAQPPPRRGYRTPILELLEHEGWITCLQWIDNNHILSSSGDSTIIRWDCHREQPIDVFRYHQADVMSIRTSPISNDIFISGGCDTLAYLWDVRLPGNYPIGTFRGHDHDINSISWMNEWAFGTSSDDNHVRLWDIRARAQVNCYPVRSSK